MMPWWAIGCFYVLCAASVVLVLLLSVWYVMEMYHLHRTGKSE